MMKNNLSLTQLIPAWVIAKNTYLEIIRERLLYGVFLIAALVTAMSFFMSTISFDQNGRILHNIGLESIHLFTLFIAIFVTTNAIGKDLERRALYLLLPKPISRTQYALGKYLGLILMVLTSLAILGGIFILGLLFIDRSVILPALINLFYSFLEISLLVSLTQLFASFTAPLNASLYGIALFIVGHSLTTLRDFFSKSGPAFLGHLIDALYVLLPNLEKFDVRTATLYHIPLGASQVFWTIFYWLVYVCFALTLTSQVLKKREF
jgi:Cu-processing system permease protein